MVQRRKNQRGDGIFSKSMSERPKTRNIKGKRKIIVQINETCIYLYIYISVSIYIYIERERERENILLFLEIFIISYPVSKGFL